MARKVHWFETERISEIRLTISRTLRVATLMAVLLCFHAAVSASKHDKDHRDAFMTDEPGDSRLINQVRHALLMLPYYGVFDDLAFKVDGGAVTLLGAVTRPTLKSDAEAAVKHIEGVERVINEIEVLPLSPMDDSIRLAEYRAIYGDPALSTRYGYRSLPPIHIIVKNGNVTLEGTVANKADADLAYVRANSVPGVFSVTNDLQVEK
jgi:hyperosmotically inducible protein